LDLALPETSGIDAAQAIKKTPLTTNVAIITLATQYAENN
jgi:hypothetical protein